MARRGQRLAGIAAQLLRHRGLVGQPHQLAQRAGVLVLAGQHVQQRGPQVRIPAEPVEDVPVEQLGVEQPGGGAVQPVLALLAIPEAIWAFQRPVPRMPGGSVCVLDVQVDCHLADVVQQGGVGGSGGPRLGLRGLDLGRCARGQQMGLPQLQGIGHDFQPVVEHATRVGVVMAFGGGKGLHQLGVSFQWRQIQRRELLARERGSLPDVFQQSLPARGRQQRRGRRRPR